MIGNVWVHNFKAKEKKRKQTNKQKTRKGIISKQNTYSNIETGGTTYTQQQKKTQIKQNLKNAMVDKAVKFDVTLTSKITPLYLSDVAVRQATHVCYDY